MGDGRAGWDRTGHAREDVDVQNTELARRALLAKAESPRKPSIDMAIPPLLLLLAFGLVSRHVDA
jgi:hypothetical protein